MIYGDFQKLPPSKVDKKIIKLELFLFKYYLTFFNFLYIEYNIHIIALKDSIVPNTMANIATIKTAV